MKTQQSHGGDTTRDRQWVREKNQIHRAMKVNWATRRAALTLWSRFFSPTAASRPDICRAVRHSWITLRLNWEGFLDILFPDHMIKDRLDTGPPLDRHGIAQHSPLNVWIGSLKRPLKIIFVLKEIVRSLSVYHHNLHSTTKLHVLYTIVLFYMPIVCNWQVVPCHVPCVDIADICNYFAQWE